MKKGRVEKINSRGYERGWHAEQLEQEAKQAGKTMAALYGEKLRASPSSAFNVPAAAERVTSSWIYYRFMDGSTDRYPAPERYKYPGN
jgi:hypothetical protein